MERVGQQHVLSYQTPIHDRQENTRSPRAAQASVPLLLHERRMNMHISISIYIYICIYIYIDR
jgi:hypothetical protein